jgi:hypothetical protein
LLVVRWPFVALLVLALLFPAAALAQRADPGPRELWEEFPLRERDASRGGEGAGAPRPEASPAPGPASDRSDASLPLLAAAGLLVVALGVWAARRAAAHPGRSRRAQPGDQPLDDTATCRIAWSPRPGRSRFEAVIEGETGTTRTTLISPSFWWPSARVPTRTPEALRAHRSLVELLKQGGWEVEGQGREWFATRLRHP